MMTEGVSRRTVITGAAGMAAGGFLARNTLGLAADQQPAASPRASPVPSGLESHVDVGLAYFRRRAADQLPLVEALRDAIAGGDLESAKDAYVVSRPPYEEIEVLAASFPETDEAIDARPYAFEAGESSPEFKGFHRIEILLYREGDPASALPVAEELIRSAETLRRDLTIRDNFSAAGHFDGMIALANEVASKKISSEEETWSDQSMLIFRHNWIGIWSQYQPFGAEVSARDPSLAEETAATYREAMTLADAAFGPGSVAAAPYSQVPVATRGEIVRASYALRDALMASRDVLGIGAE